MTATRRRLWLAGLAGALLLLLVAVSAGGSAPQACGQCHATARTNLADSSHAAVGCYACHAPGVSAVGFKTSELTQMYPAALLGRTLTGPVTETGRDACLSCHSRVLRSVAKGASGIRIDHSACAQGPSCDGCHAAVAHGDAVRWQREASMEACIACHRERKAPVDCETCHVGRLERERFAASPWRVTHGPDWKDTHGMGDLETCATCHESTDCARCHGVEVPHPASFGDTHGTSAIADREKCTTCHRSQQFCDSCHGMTMPHGTGFLQRHSKETSDVEDARCQRCHTVADCQECHERHIHPGNAKTGLESEGGR